MNPNQGSDIHIGLMSGTSLDGVDIAIVDFAIHPPRGIYTNTIPYSNDLRQKLRKLTHAQTTSLDELFGLEAELTEVYAEVVVSALRECNLTNERISALGCHGQTLCHRPEGDPPFTVQICDPGHLAVLTGITTVADFRRKDIALGGQGAPLAPAFHQFLLASEQENRVVINIGGIANITLLPASSGQSVIGFDTGPGNTFLDFWMQQHQGQVFDRNGDWARAGQANTALLNKMLAGEPYFIAQYPKSTGTEYFNPDWLAQRLDSSCEPVDVQATLAELTAITISSAISNLPIPVDRCFVCGGGAHNSYLLERLAAALPDVGLQTTENLGIDPDFVEASAFAWLARARLLGQTGNLPEVTAASRATILGGVYHAD